MVATVMNNYIRHLTYMIHMKYSCNRFGVDCCNVVVSGRNITTGRKNKETVIGGIVGLINPIHYL